MVDLDEWMDEDGNGEEGKINEMDIASMKSADLPKTRHRKFKSL